MMHPDTVLRTVDETIGVGVFATRPIPRGTLTWVRDPLDLVLSSAVLDAMESLPQRFVHRYAWQEGDAWILCWDHGRFVNHACDPNCLGLGVDFEVAIRDIAAGEQLTDDYRSLGPLEEPFDCACGSPRCQRRLQPAEPWLHRQWRDAFRGGLERFGAVPQPLAPWLKHDDLVRAGLGAPGDRPNGRTGGRAAR